MTDRPPVAPEPEGPPTGPGAAAILAAGIGCCVFGLLALATDAVPAVDRLLSFWPPSGSLSGVSTSAVLVWLATWLWIGRRWRHRDIALVPVTVSAVSLLAISVLLTFPPVMDLLQGK